MSFFPENGKVGNPLKRGVADLAVIFLVVIVSALLVESMTARPKDPVDILAMAMTLSAIYTGLIFYFKGYQSAWRFFSAHDAVRCLIASGAATLVTLSVWSGIMPLAGWFITACGVVLSSIFIRCSVRLVCNYGLFRVPSTLDNPLGQERISKQPKQALMIGYGENLETFLRAQRKRDADFDVIGIVSMARKNVPTSLRGTPVLGSIDQIDTIVRTLKARRRGPDVLILTRDELAGYPIAELLSEIDIIDAEIAWLPRSDQLNTRDATNLLPIKLEDLLPRSAKSFDAHACEALLSGARVLLTGASGSIGSELVRQIAALSPREIILTDNSEHALYELDREISANFPGVPRVSVILDVRDRHAVFRTVEQYKPEFIFHAAALKHVPIVEMQPCEGLLTNVVGSQNVADAAVAYKARAMVMVSTDKAVNPANIMGATKRMAEAYCQAMNSDMRAQGGCTRFVTVRFGNVLGSNGSVVPLFQRQLAQGVLTVTHPDVERFFMTILEASRLILEAMLVGMDDDKAEQGIFVLDMGRPVKIVDLARQVIRLSGLRPEIDVKIVYTGLRAGEKLYEELVHEKENLLPTDHESLMVAQPRFVQLKTIRNQISLISAAAREGNEFEVVRLLKVYIPEFDKTSHEAKQIREQASNVVFFEEHKS